jgi:hypothetical protein
MNTLDQNNIKVCKTLGIQQRLLPTAIKTISLRKYHCSVVRKHKNKNSGVVERNYKILQLLGEEYKDQVDGLRGADATKKWRRAHRKTSCGEHEDTWFVHRDEKVIS